MTRRGFTLIELLIVIAIIAILALIAVPNFLEAQVRAKVSRAHADMRTIASAVEAYAVEWGTFPLDADDIPYYVDYLHQELWDQKRMYSVLTTPVGYLSSVPNDPFNVSKAMPSADPTSPETFTAVLFPGLPPYPYTYIAFGSEHAPSGYIPYPPPFLMRYQPVHRGHPDHFGLISLGPNRLFDGASVDSWPNVHYDPTNGTVTAGDILRWNKPMPEEAGP